METVEPVYTYQAIKDIRKRYDETGELSSEDIEKVHTYIEDKKTAIERLENVKKHHKVKLSKAKALLGIYR